MDYRVVVTPDAEDDFECFLTYLLMKRNNPQAARHFIDDFEATKQRLATVAGSIKLCDNECLKQNGYRRLNFIEMDYFVLFRIVGDTVIIDKVFHDLQDYEHKMY